MERGNVEEVGEVEGLRGDFRRTNVEIGVVAGNSVSVAHALSLRREAFSDRAVRYARFLRWGTTECEGEVERARFGES